MAKSPIHTPEQLRQLLRYERETGRLFWLPRTPDMFTQAYHSADKQCRTWNTRYAGREAFCLSQAGYMKGAVWGRCYTAHRVIWAMVTGEWPDVIDHINGNPADNRFENLRSVRQVDNCGNQRRYSTNKSGVTGVLWDKQHGRWNAQLRRNGVKVFLGRFDTIEEAAAARRAGEVGLGFHANHGRG